MPGERLVKQLKIILITILAVLAIVILLQNTDAVETQLLFVQVTMPRAVLLMITLLIGFIVGLITGGLYVRRRR